MHLVSSLLVEAIICVKYMLLIALESVPGRHGIKPSCAWGPTWASNTCLVVYAGRRSAEADIAKLRAVGCASNHARASLAAMALTGASFDKKLMQVSDLSQRSWRVDPCGPALDREERRLLLASSSGSFVGGGGMAAR